MSGMMEGNIKYTEDYRNDILSRLVKRRHFKYASYLHHVQSSLSDTVEG